MSDSENDVSYSPNAGDEEPLNDLDAAVAKVLKNALKQDGVVRGLHQVAKVVESKQALVCFLAESCTEPAYKKLVHALCKAHDVPLIDVPDSKQLGKWAGLFVTRKENEVKIVGASCVAITDYGEDSAAHNFLQTHIASLA
ncbi:ribosomal protein RPS12 [Cardiosporidium cionae]|uniref:40S ribosomal protein S12 n=1 Tax=Cardiosporidium cionae TaxID=476202 RepID=A0ABQ7J5K9_9APIC|nr:ribosomal protein RPS12 [Cardiosporidium cionae]|eukprot:KAF8819248.1 ribosomal protein RPS12 [Cardiosporidium cionae]